MKETQLKTDEKIEIVNQKEVQKQEVLIGRIKPKRGHTLFEYNKLTKEIKKASFDSIDISFEKAMEKDISANKKVTINSDCLYITALNENNVRKILKREYGI